VKTKGIALFSGGMDSLVEVKVIQEQGIDVIGMTFITPFFGPEKARKAARQVSIDLHVVDITREHLAMMKAPRYGFGRNMNPCIDCHALMLKTAGGKMAELNADFLFTGEVLGQRPMSQTRQSLHVVAKHSGFENYILRPLSALLLPEISAEREGKIDRSKLLDIQGRGRKRQMELAEKYGIDQYSNPAGGCLLTDPIFSKRLKDLFKYDSNFQTRDLELLKAGRHIRLNERVKIIVGKNERDNIAIQNLCNGDTLLHTANHPGPVVLIPSHADNTDLEMAAAICVRYSDAPKGTDVDITCEANGVTRLIRTKSADPEGVAQMMI
jgi:tRNA U34 2-thiouridine synthase MnmA/TrmU